MGIPSNGNVIDSQAYFIREAMEIYGDLVELVYPKVCVRRMFHDYARNCIVDEFLESDCDVLWFLDSDITPPKHVLDMVTIHLNKWKVAGATYPIFMCPPGSQQNEILFTGYRFNTETGNLALSSIPMEGTDFLDGLATGCIFIKREVFTQMEKPYFEFKFEPKSRSMTEGEDLGFFLKLNKLGIRCFTDYSMVCKHQKHIDLLEVNNYAMSYANRSVMKYDENIQPQVKAAVENAYQQGLKQGIKLASGTKEKESTIWTP